MKTKAIHIISILGIFFLLNSLYVSAQNDTGRNGIYLFVEQMPSFPGDFDNYMATHLQYPQSAYDKGIHGTVHVSFVVSKTGQISNVKILLPVSPDLDSEAVRVVKNMPPWTPGLQGGKPVNVEMNLPVYFILSNVQNKNQSPEQRQAVSRPRDTIFILRDGLYVDPYVGYGEGGPMASSATSAIPAVNTGGNLKLGAGITYMFPSNLGVSVGLQIQQYNFNYTFSNANPPSDYNGTVTKNRTSPNDTTITGGYNENIKYTFMYAQLPLLCRYISSQENKLGFYAEAGLVVSYLLTSAISGNVTQTQYHLTQAANTYWYMYNTTSSNSVTVSMASQNPAKLTFSFHLAAGVIIPFNSKVSLILAASPDLGIMNAGDGSKDVVNFGTSQYYLYGKGNYGSFNSYTFDAKLLIKIAGDSKTIRVQ